MTQQQTAQERSDKAHIRYAFGAIAIVVICVMALNYSGFCYSKRTWMSDDDYIRRAVEERVSRSYMRDQYKSIDDFLAKNPRCCTVYRFSGPAHNNWLFALICSYQVVVAVNYPIVDDGEHVMYQAEVIVTSCGKPSFDRGIGSPISHGTSESAPATCFE